MGNYVSLEGHLGLKLCMGSSSLELRDVGDQQDNYADHSV